MLITSWSERVKAATPKQGKYRGTIGVGDKFLTFFTSQSN